MDDDTAWKALKQFWSGAVLSGMFLALGHFKLATCGLAAADPQLKLLGVQKLPAKQKCFLLDTKRSEVRLKGQWLPPLVPDDTIRKALEGFGCV